MYVHEGRFEKLCFISHPTVTMGDSYPWMLQDPSSSQSDVTFDLHKQTIYQTCRNPSHDEILKFFTFYSLETKELPEKEIEVKVSHNIKHEPRCDLFTPL